MSDPNFFLIGAPRCGTTTLHGLLGAHPSVFMSPNKEPWFYAFSGDDPPFSGPGDGQGVRDRAEYERLFANAGEAEVIGEASTLYLASNRAPEAIRIDVPHAKIVAVLRDPVERAFSNYSQHRWQGREPLPFPNALAAGPERVAQGWAPFWDYRAMSRYGEQLARWYDAFPANQIKVLAFDDLVRDETGVLRELFAFLGVDVSFRPPQLGPANAAGRPRSERLHAFLRGSSRSKQALRSVVPTRLRVRLRAEIDRRNREDVGAIPPDQALELAAGYADQLTLAEELIGHNLPAWLDRWLLQP